jgi:hypothetical protein
MSLVVIKLWKYSSYEFIVDDICISYYININIPREDLKRACSPFLSRLEEVFAAKGDFIREM